MRRRSPLAFGPIIGSTLFLWLGTAIAATAFWPVYEGPRYVLMVLITTLVASAIAITGGVFRLPAHVVALAGLVVFLLIGVPLAVPDAALFGVLPSIDGLRELLYGTALGWKQLLTITLPVGGYQALLVPAFILVFLTVLISLSVALRTRFAGLAVIGPIVLYLAALAFGDESTFYPRFLALALAATVLFWLIWLRWIRRTSSLRVFNQAGAKAAPRATEDFAFGGFRTLVSAVLVVGLAAGGALLATRLLPPTGDRDVLRSAVVQPFNPRDYPSPLSGFRRYHQVPNETRAMLTVVGLPDRARIRIATLDSYDGIVYSVGTDRLGSESGSFTLVPGRVDRSAESGQRVSLVVTVEDYTGVWLPTVGDFDSIDFGGDRASDLRASFYFNDYTGTAAVLEEVGEGDRYRLNAVIPAEPVDAALARLTPGSAQQSALGVVPQELSEALDGYVGQTAGDGARLLAAITGLREDGYISHGVSADEPKSRSGHSADRITELVTDSRMIGDEEQYAVAAAVMARELGFPARVVVGFQPSEVDPEGATVVTGADISAWIEVNTAQFGWVTVDPTPPMREIPEEELEEPTQVARPQSPVQPPVVEEDPAEDQLPPVVAQEDVPELSPFLAVLFAVLQIGGGVLAIVAILLSPFVAIVAAKVGRRRRRRRARTPLARVSGGWEEFEDAVLDHGFTPPPAPTRTEFAGVIGGALPLVLASTADRATFSPTVPDAAEAALVWRSVEQLRAALNDGLTPWQRIKARISLRSFARGAAGPTNGSRASR